MSPAKKVLHESVVLRPRDPSITNSDDWPEFRLNNATVTLPSTPKTASSSNESGEAVSLLLAAEHNPLTITGQLDPPSKDQAHAWLTKPSSRSPVTIEVSDVCSFSYGAYEDGSVELWAAGRAGWFVVRPSKRYKAIYEEMVDGVKMLFFIVDAYSTPRKSGKGKNATILPDYTAQEVFEKYAIEVMGVEKGAPEAAKKMYNHREFLLSSMIEGKEGIAWSKNPLYLHLCRKFAADAKKIKQRRAAAAAVKEKEAEREEVKVAPAAHTREASLDSTSTSSSLKRKRGRPPKDVISIDSSSVEDSSTVVVKSAQTSKTKEAPKAATTGMTKATRSTRSNPAPSTPEIPDSQPTTPAVEQESDSEVPHRRRKSALRLKPNKSTKGPPKRSSKLGHATGDEEDGSGDESSIAVSVNGGKRKRGQTISNTKTADQTRTTRHTKRANGNTRSSRSRTKHSTETEAVDEGIDIPTSPSSDDAVGGAADLSNNSNTEDLAIRLLHLPDQLQENVWTCALDSCTHKVYGPLSDSETQRLIREHYALHAYDDDDRVRMVKGMAEPSLPINYLVERVRGQVRSEGMGFVGSSLKGVGTRFPEPLATKF